MEDKELIAKIQVLKTIRPDQQWVSVNKTRLFNEFPSGAQKPKFVLENILVQVREFLGERLNSVFSSQFRLRPAYRYAVPFLLFAAVAVSGFFARSIWSIYKGMLAEQMASIGANVNNLNQSDAELNLALVEQQVKQLKAMSRQAEPEELALALQEYQQNLKKAAESLNGKPEDTATILKIAEKVKQIDQATKEIELELKTAIAPDEREALKDKALAYVQAEIEETKSELQGLVGREIADLKGRALKDEQQLLLKEAEDLFAKENYQAAFEIITRISH